MDIYDVIYGEALKNATEAGISLGFSKEAFRMRVKQTPYNICFSEFNDCLEADLQTSMCLRVVNCLPNVYTEKNYSRIQKKYGTADCQMAKWEFLMYLGHQYAAWKAGIKIINDMPSCTMGERIRMQRLRIHYALKEGLNILGHGLKYVFHMYVFEPIWNRLSNNTKNRVRVAFGRKAK